MGKATERVKREIVCNDAHDGGLNMINLRDFRDGFLLSWVEKLLTEDENTEWIHIPLENFEKVGGKGIFGNEIDFKDIKGKDEIFSKFWY